MTIKSFIFIFLVAIPFNSGAQERDNTYKLFKNGKEYERPVLYLLENSFEKIYREGQDLFFLTEREKFVHNPNIHSSFKLQDEELDKLDFHQPRDLYSFEEKEYKEKAESILQETGVKPIPPIKHIILKVHIVRKEEEGYCAYEVKWM